MEYIDHDRDYEDSPMLVYVRYIDKYLVQDRSSGKVYETPTVHVYA